MTPEERTTLDNWEKAISDANTLQNGFAEVAPDPVGSELVSTLASSINNTYPNLWDSDLKDAINAANLVWYNSIKAALETSKTSNQASIDSLVTTDASS